MTDTPKTARVAHFDEHDHRISPEDRAVVNDMAAALHAVPEPYASNSGARAIWGEGYLAGAAAERAKVSPAASRNHLLHLAASVKGVAAEMHADDARTPDVQEAGDYLFDLAREAQQPPPVEVHRETLETTTSAVHSLREEIDGISQRILGENMNRWAHVAREFGVTMVGDITFGADEFEVDELDDDDQPTGRKVPWTRFWAERTYTRTNGTR